MSYTVGTLLVSDSFNRSNNIAVGSTDGGVLGPLPWTTGAGASLTSYKIDGNQLASNMSPSIEPMWVVTGKADVRVQGVVTTLPDSGANFGLTLRATNVNDLYWFGLDFTSGFKAYLQRRDSITGNVDNLIVSSGTYTAPATLRVDLWRNEIRCYVNGTLIGTAATSPFNATATRHGVWTNSDDTGRLNDFAIWELVSDAGHCAEFVGTVTGVVASSNVQLSVASNTFPDALSNYRIDFFADTTSGVTPSSGLLNGGPWTIGPMNTGESISYAITRVDGAHIDGSCVMRATDTAFGLFWDLTVQCTPFARQALVF